MTKTWCVGDSHYSDTVNQNIYEKRILKLIKLVKLSKELVVFADETNHKFLLSK